MPTAGELFADTLETVREHFQIAVSQVVRRRPGRNRARRRSRHPGERHRDRRPAAGQRAAQHFAAQRRRKDADLRGVAAGDLPQPAQPVLRAGRSRRRAGRSEHRALCRRAARVSGLDAVHRRHALEKNDGLRETLYGITMQESGVSKRVSVRFEDVSDNGEIVPVRESQAPPNQDETQAA